MSYIRKITNSEELSKIIDLPDDLKNKKVEVIILPYEENTKTKKSHKSLQGSLKKYKNQELINEENTAWEKMVKDKYETFKADKDGIIPVLDKEYFDDDIVCLLYTSPSPRD